MPTLSKYGIFGQFSDAIGHYSQVERHVTYIYSERRFYWLSYPFLQNTKNCFCFREIDLLAIP